MKYDLLAPLRAVKGRSVRAETSGRVMVSTDMGPGLIAIATAVASQIRANLASARTPDGASATTPPTAATRRRRIADGGDPSAPRGISTGRLVTSLTASPSGRAVTIAAREEAPGQLARALGTARLLPQWDAPAVRDAIGRALRSLITRA